MVSKRSAVPSGVAGRFAFLGLFSGRCAVCPSVFLKEMTFSRSRVFFRGSVSVDVLRAVLEKAPGIVGALDFEEVKRFAPENLLQAFAEILSVGLPVTEGVSAEESADFVLPSVVCWRGAIVRESPAEDDSLV